MSISKKEFEAKKNGTAANQYNVDQLGGKHFKSVLQHMAKEKEYTASQMRVQTSTLLATEQNMNDLTDQAKTVFGYLNDIYKVAGSEKSTATSARYSHKKIDRLIEEIEKNTLMTLEEKKSALKQAKGVKRHISYRQETDLNKTGFMMKTLKEQLPSIAGIVTGVLGNNVASMFVGNFVQGLVDNRREERNSMIESAEEYYKDSLLNEIKANKERRELIEEQPEDTPNIFIDTNDITDKMNEFQNRLVSLIGGDNKTLNSLSDDDQIELLSSIFDELQNSNPKELSQTLNNIQASLDNNENDALNRLRGLKGKNDATRIQEEQISLLEEIAEGVNKEDKKDKDSHWFTPILLGLGGLSGLLSGLVIAKATILSSALGVLTSATSTTSNALEKIIPVYGNVLNGLRTFASSIIANVKGMGKLISEAGMYVAEGITSSGRFIIDGFSKRLNKLFDISAIVKVFDISKSPFITKGKALLNMLFGESSWFMKSFNLFKKIALPLQIMLSIYDGISGFIQTEGNIKDKLEGAFKKVFHGLVDWIFDISSWIARQINSLLGLETDFDLNKHLVPLEDALIGFLFNPIDSLIKWFNDMAGTIQSWIPSWMGGGPKEISLPKEGNIAPPLKSSHEKIAANPEEAIEKLMGKGWTKEQAIGIAGNLEVESGFDPSAVGDGGKAYGIAQWHPDRQEEFEKFSGKNIRGSSVDEQLEFLNHELTKGKEQKAGDIIRSTASIEDAAIATDKYYERSSGQHRQRRIDEARTLGGMSTIQDIESGDMLSSKMTKTIDSKKNANDNEKKTGKNEQIFAPVSNSSIVSNSSTSSNHFAPGTARDNFFARDQFKNY